MDTSSGGLPQRSGTFRAVVHAGTAATAYLRIGTGRPVVCLRSTATPAWDLLIARLSSAFCVLVPDLPATTPAAPDWLTSFLDGLGLTDAIVVAESPAGVVDPWHQAFTTLQVARVLLLVPEPAMADAAATDHLVRLPATAPTATVVAAVAQLVATTPG